MPNNGFLSIGGTAPVGSGSSRTPRSAERKPSTRATPVSQGDSGQRLLIEQDSATGAPIYVVIDRDSGEIVAQLSRDQVAKMGGEAGYAAGALIKAKA